MAAEKSSVFIRVLLRPRDSRPYRCRTGTANTTSYAFRTPPRLSRRYRDGTRQQYVTVAMRYSLIDRTLDRASGRLVEGSDRPQETTELWTFRRVSGGKWLLSAIQQT